MDEAAALLFETGYRKPTVQLTLSDKVAIKSSLLDYHCMIKVKAAMDQFAEGLDVLHVLQLIKRFPHLTKPMFVDDDTKVLTAGKEIWYESIYHSLYSSTHLNVHTETFV